eukprot:5809150-Alexandrium_andersonii.AAC.1
MHQVTAHDYKSGVSARTDVVWCPACLKYFHTYRRLMHHMLRDVPRCGRLVVENMPELEGARPYEARRGALAKLPIDAKSDYPPQHRAVVLMPGPLPRWAAEGARAARAST